MIEGSLRERLVAEARKLLKRPFVHQGRNEFGVDCVGVAVLPMRAVGIDPPDLTAYDRYSAGKALPTQLALIAVRIDLDDAEGGDVLTFPHESIRSRAEKREEHFAWLVSRWRMLHAWDQTRGVVEHELDERWRRRVTGVWRLRAVAEDDRARVHAAIANLASRAEPVELG